MVPSRLLDQAPGRARQKRRGDHEHRDRLDLYQGAALGLWRKRGAQAQAIGLSRGGKTTKIHALTDVVGRPFRLILTPGNVADVKAAPVLLEQPTGAQHLLGDKGYDSDALREQLRSEGVAPVIPGRSNRKTPVVLDKERYKDRHLVENAFCRIKDFRRVATRYDKLAINFLSTVALAVVLAYWL
jgi:transposase